MPDSNPFGEDPLDATPRGRQAASTPDFGMQVGIPAAASRDNPNRYAAVRESGPPPIRGTRARSRTGPAWGIPVLIVAAVLVVLAALAVVWAHGGSDSTSKHVAPTSSSTPSRQPSTPRGDTPSAENPLRAPGCVEQREANTVTGVGPGGTESGPDAILGFEHAYYVDRSGVRARLLVLPESVKVTAAEQIQQGIDSVPVGTRYCVRIARAAVGRWRVELTEARPGEVAVTFVQMVTTVVVDGRTMINEITGG